MVDAGWIRFLWPNRHQVTPHFWRSGQPTPSALAHAKALGIRTVVNLRGEGRNGAYVTERRRCRVLGLDYVDCWTRSRAAPTAEDMIRIATVFDTVSYPIMVHCKSGADRAGLITACYLLMEEDATIAQAQAALHLRYGHFSASATGVLDAYLAVYARAHRLDPKLDFRTWAQTPGQAEAVQASFAPRPFWGWFVDRVLRRE
jgi:protein tyrosine phosphatase (PTP) superfamily phosphohydrolase (DUF442 family)